MTVKLTNVTSFWQLLADAPKGKVTSLFLLMILASLTDGIGLLLLVPLLSVIDGGSSLNPFIEHLLHVLTLLGIPPTMNGLLSVFVLLVACRSAIQYGREQMGAKLQHELVDQLRLKCFRALLEAEWRWLVGRRQSDHANLLMSDVSRVGMGLNFGISLMASSITIVAYLFAAFALSWSMTSLALLTGSIGFLLLSGQRNKAFSLGYNQTRASRSLQANVQESLAGIKLAKILVNEQRHLDFFTHVTHTLRQQQLAFGASTSLSKAFFQFGGAALLACYLYLGLSIWHIPVPELLILILIFSRLIPQFMAGQQQFHHLLHALPALQETQLLLTDCQNFAEPPHTESKEKWPITNSISFKQVYVSYKEREKPILHNLTLSFQARTTTAIIGAYSDPI